MGDFDYVTSEDFEGRAGRPMTAARLHVPRDIRVEGEFLTWDWSGGKDNRPPPGPAEWKELLNRFWRLKTATPDQVLRLAKTWGPLGACEHFRFGTCFECSQHGSPPVPRIYRLVVPNGKEPIEAWRRLAKQAADLVTIANEVQQEGRATKKQWDEFLMSVEADSWFLEGFPFMSDRYRIRFLLEEWLRESGAGFALAWGEHEPRPSMRVDVDLFGVIALQTAAAVSGSPGVFFCSACGLPYFRRRVPKAGHDNYCKQPECQAESRNSSRRADGKKQGRASRAMSKGESE